MARDSATDKRVKLVFINPTARPCAITRYVLSWPGGSKPAQPDSFRIPAGESRERWLIVHPNDGDLSALTPDAAKITIEADCSAP